MSNDYFTSSGNGITYQDPEGKPYTVYSKDEYGVIFQLADERDGPKFFDENGKEVTTFDANGEPTLDPSAQKPPDGGDDNSGDGDGDTGGDEGGGSEDISEQAKTDADAHINQKVDGGRNTPDKNNSGLEHSQGKGAFFEPGTVRMEDFRHETYKHMVALLENVSENISPGHQDGWHSASVGILADLDDFKTAIGKLNDAGGWQGETHKAAMKNLSLSYARPEIMAQGCENMGIVTEYFSEIMSTTKHNILDQRELYDADKKAYTVDSVDEYFDKFMRQAMGGIYAPDIKDVNDNLPGFIKEGDDPPSNNGNGDGDKDGDGDDKDGDGDDKDDDDKDDNDDDGDGDDKDGDGDDKDGDGDDKDGDGDDKDDYKKGYQDGFDDARDSNTDANNNGSGGNGPGGDGLGGNGPGGDGLGGNGPGGNGLGANGPGGGGPGGDTNGTGNNDPGNNQKSYTPPSLNAPPSDTPQSHTPPPSDTPPSLHTPPSDTPQSHTPPPSDTPPAYTPPDLKASDPHTPPSDPRDVRKTSATPADPDRPDATSPAQRDIDPKTRAEAADLLKDPKVADLAKTLLANPKAADLAKKLLEDPDNADLAKKLVDPKLAKAARELLDNPELADAARDQLGLPRGDDGATDRKDGLGDEDTDDNGDDDELVGNESQFDGKSHPASRGIEGQGAGLSGDTAPPGGDPVAVPDSVPVPDHAGAQGVSHAGSGGPSHAGVGAAGGLTGRELAPLGAPVAATHDAGGVPVSQSHVSDPLGQGAGSPGGGMGGGGHRGGGGDSKDYKVNKALRNVNNGQWVIGESEAVLPVIGWDGADVDSVETPSWDFTP